MAKQKYPNRTAQPKPQQSAEPKQAQVAAPVPEGAFPVKWLVVILLAVAFVVNVPTLGYDYTLDDPFFTRDNPMVREGMSSIPEFFKHAAYYGVFKNHDASYRPLLLISFAVEKQLVGDFNPTVAHFVNLILFCLQILAMFLLLRRVFNKYSIFIPFFITLLFELHPIHTEVVASVKSRDEIMSLLFVSLCMLKSFKYIDTGKVLNLGLSGIYFFVALMAKETPICFVAIMPLTIYFFRDVKLKQIVMACVPYVLVAAIYMGMRAAFIENEHEKVVILVNNNALMAATNAADKLATALFIQLKYVLLLFFPVKLSYDYSYNQIPIIGFSDVKTLASIIVLFGAGIYALMNVKRKSVFSYGILFYFALMALTANIIVDIGATMAERFAYTASLGYCIILVFLIVKLFKADSERLSYVNGSKVFIACIVIAGLYGIKTLAQNGVWKDNLTLYEAGIETAPESWRSHNLLAVQYTKMLRDEKDAAKKNEIYRKAITNFNESIRILPTTEVFLLQGYAYEFGGHDDSALMAYKSVLLYDKTNPQAINNTANIYLRRGVFDSTIRILGNYIVQDSSHADMLCNLAAAYGNTGHFPEALKYYGMAMKIEPNPPANVLTSLTNIYVILGDSTKAQYYRGLLRKSQDGHNL